MRSSEGPPRVLKTLEKSPGIVRGVAHSPAQLEETGTAAKLGHDEDAPRSYGEQANSEVRDGRFGKNEPVLRLE